MTRRKLGKPTVLASPPVAVSDDHMEHLRDAIRRLPMPGPRSATEHREWLHFRLRQRGLVVLMGGAGA